MFQRKEEREPPIAGAADKANEQKQEPTNADLLTHAQVRAPMRNPPRPSQVRFADLDDTISQQAGVSEVDQVKAT